MDEIILSRKKLYDLVWSEPLLTLAKKYNISDVGLRKICIRMGVPLPKSGYWSKMKAGKTVEAHPLPIFHEGVQQVTLKLRIEGQEIDEAELSPQMVLQKAIEHDPFLNLSVPDTLFNPDPLVFRAKKSLTKRQEYYTAGGLLNTGLGEIDIRVAPENVERALCIIDTFIKAMRLRGHEFKVDERESYIVLGGENVKMTL